MSIPGDESDPDAEDHVTVEESSNGKWRKFYIKPGIEWVLKEIQLMRTIV